MGVERTIPLALLVRNQSEGNEQCSDYRAWCDQHLFD